MGAGVLSRAAKVMTFVIWIPTIFLTLVHGPVPALVWTGLPLVGVLAWAAWYRLRLSQAERAAAWSLMRGDPDVWLLSRWLAATVTLALVLCTLAAFRVNEYEPLMWIEFAVTLGWAIVWVAAIQSGGRPLSVPTGRGAVLNLRLRIFRATALLTFVPWALATEPAPWADRAVAGTVVLVILAGYVLVAFRRSKGRPERDSSPVVKTLVGISPASATALIAFVLAASYLPWQMPDWAMVEVFLVIAVAWLLLPFGLLLGAWRLVRRP